VSRTTAGQTAFQKYKAKRLFAPFFGISDERAFKERKTMQGCENGQETCAKRWQCVICVIVLKIVFHWNLHAMKAISRKFEFLRVQM
jgi:hypothetical protein